MAIGFEERLLCKPATQHSLDSVAINTHGSLLEGQSMDSGYSIKSAVIPNSLYFLVGKWRLYPVEFESSELWEKCPK